MRSKWQLGWLAMIVATAAMGAAAAMTAESAQPAAALQGQGKAAVPEGPAAPCSAPRLDAWVVIGPGGGGGQFNPTVSPLDSNKVLMSCDMTGAYISNDGGETWRMFNARSTVSFFVFDPVDANVIYSYRQGLMRSADGGKTWNLVFPDPANVDRNAITDGDTIATKDGTRERISALAVDPADSKTLYTARSQGFWVSTDWGKTWKRNGELPDGGQAIYVDPKSPKGDRTVYVIGAASASVREGGKWTRHEAPKGVEAFRYVSGGFGGDGKGLTIYVVAGARRRRGAETAEGASGVYRSADGGATWGRIDAGLVGEGGNAANPLAVATCLTKPDVAYVSYENLIESSDDYFGVAKTADGGKTWRFVWKEHGGAAGANIYDAWITERLGSGWGDAPRCLGVAPTNADICYGGDDGRTMRTTDGGKTWVGVYSKRAADGNWSTTGLDVTTCYGVHFDPFDPKRMFIGYTDIGLFVSDNYGTTWRSATAKNLSQNSILASAGCEASVLRCSSSTMLFPCIASSSRLVRCLLARPLANGASSEINSNGVPHKWMNTTYWMAFDPKVKGRAWAAMSDTHDLPRPKMWDEEGNVPQAGGVCVTSDSGETWQPTNGGMPETNCTHILLDPASPVDARVLYVTGFGTGIWKSADGGVTWKLKNSGIADAKPFAWRLTRDSKGVLYAVMARKAKDNQKIAEFGGRLYRSTDAAESWQEVKLPEGCNGPSGLAIDPKDDKRLYLAAWGGMDRGGAGGGGIFVSADGGATWKNVLAKDQHIYDITIDPRDASILYACGFESSAWRSADRGETWKRIRGFNFKWGHRVIPDPYHEDKIFITTFGGSVWYGPAEGDPKAKDDIVTPEIAYDR
jgi:photosystem II stability/assembly factor-like uncharacterized protein